MNWNKFLIRKQCSLKIPPRLDIKLLFYLFNENNKIKKKLIRRHLELDVRV